MTAQVALNFAARQNKSIERSLVFESLQLIQSRGLLANGVYVGFGSVWFTDFQLAHRLLSVQRLVSLEHNAGSFERAIFNRPFRAVEVRQGSSHDLLPDMLNDDELTASPWILWMDYDKELAMEEIEDLRVAAARVPAGSVVLTTFNAYKANYTTDPEDKHTRVDYLRSIFGEDLTADLDWEAVSTQPNFYGLIAELVTRLLQSAASSSGRDAAYVPLFNIRYADGIEMLTVGGMFPGAGQHVTVQNLCSDAAWPGTPEHALNLPPLTAKEVLTLRAMLPKDDALSAQEVQDASGLSLKQSVIDGFQRHYLRFPVYLDVAGTL